MFGRQKGAGEEELIFLEKGMETYTKVLNGAAKKAVDIIPGAGAAGGLGAALYAICETRHVSGSQYVMEALHLEEKIQNCDYVITGEGAMDAQSLEGKVPISIARIARRYEKPVIAFVGMSRGDEQAYYAQGITAIFCILKKMDTVKNMLKNAGRNLQFTVENFARVLKDCNRPKAE